MKKLLLTTATLPLLCAACDKNKENPNNPNTPTVTAVQLSRTPFL